MQTFVQVRTCIFFRQGITNLLKVILVEVCVDISENGIIKHIAFLHRITAAQKQ